MIARKIKIVHISASAKGGAGTAAYRLHEALLSDGIDSHFVCIDGIIDSNLKFCTRLQQKPFQISLLNTLTDKIKWRLKNHFNFIVEKGEYFSGLLKQMRPTLRCETATLPFSDFNILEDPIVQSADIIHLHWVAEMLDYPSFFKFNTKPVIWTLHDMNPFQGIYHYKEDEIRNEEISYKLNQRVFHIKQKAIKNRKCSLSIVCPSQWLLTSAMQSKVFNKSQGYCIANPLDMQLFYPAEVNVFSTRLNIPQGNTVFLFVTQILENPRKGLDILLCALEKIKHSPVTLLVIGNNENFHIPELDIRILGTINGDEMLRSYYSLADAIIIASREDNLPNVMLEALACGTPVLSFNVGGMAEIIQDGFNGLKANTTDAASLVNIMTEFIKNKEKFNIQAIRNYAVQNFSNKPIAEKYKEVYKSALK